MVTFRDDRDELRLCLDFPNVARKETSIINYKQSTIDDDGPLASTAFVLQQAQGLYPSLQETSWINLYRLSHHYRILSNGTS
ncbi:hypothetical protein FHL15_001176 [Xylaria flabelliformis]|uniref:Uncharacterized protein n=1 Tax=Xylaria flabelliformis TaxID=2512241 RepID=A0A553ICP9_9PEZI|nr:hypothetical protein FHL15_001176 [Xylaria flabelliformis]